jgi:hypothetical protein
MWPWYLLLLLLVAAVAVGAWWLGTRQRTLAPSDLPAELPQPRAIPIPLDERPEPVPANPEDVEPMPAAPQAPAPRVTLDRRERSGPASSEPVGEGAEEAQPAPSADASSGRSVFPADEAVAEVPRTGPAPLVQPRVQPYRGRVVQLGAFPTRRQAEESWRRVVRRYPYLAGKPKMVNTVDVRGLGGGRPTRMYRLQLGTSSQAQSVVICQQLERAGQSCVVVY